MQGNATAFAHHPVVGEPVVGDDQVLAAAHDADCVAEAQQIQSRRGLLLEQDVDRPRADLGTGGQRRIERESAIAFVVQWVAPVPAKLA